MFVTISTLNNPILYAIFENDYQNDQTNRLLFLSIDLIAPKLFHHHLNLWQIFNELIRISNPHLSWVLWCGCILVPPPCDFAHWLWLTEISTRDPLVLTPVPVTQSTLGTDFHFARIFSFQLVVGAGGSVVAVDFLENSMPSYTVFSFLLLKQFSLMVG